MATRSSRPGTLPNGAAPRAEGAGQPEAMTIRSLAAAPPRRLLTARLVMLLTLAASWTDALSFVYLGRVFASFMTGNILFVGIAVAQGDDWLLARASLTLLTFFVGFTLGSLYLEHAQFPQSLELRATVVRYLLVEGLILLLFSLVWQLAGGPTAQPVAQIRLLGIAGFAMGLQEALIATFELPSILSVALTGVVILLGRRLAHRLGPRPTHPQHGPASAPFLIVQMLIYLVAAFVAVRWTSTPFIPCLTVAAAIAVTLVTPPTTARS